MADAHLTYTLDIAPDSSWVAATPSAVTRSVFLYVQEAGNFIAGPNYDTRRSGLDSYLLHLTLEGGGRLEYEGRGYRLLPGDILLIGPMELHQPRIAKDHGPYERMVLWLDKRYLEQLSTPQTSLTRCFDASAPGHTNLLRLAPTPRQHVTDLMERLVAETNSADYGSDLASIGCLIQLLVELNRQAANSAQHHELTDKSGPIVTNVLNYISDRDSGNKLYIISSPSAVPGGKTALKITACLAMLFFMIYWVLLALWTYQNAAKCRLHAPFWGSPCC